MNTPFSLPRRPAPRPTCAALAAVLALLAVGCGSPPPAPAAPPGWTAFGAGVSVGVPAELATLLADPEAHDGQPVLIQAPVYEVCINKGCWMTFDGGDREVRVTFRDYGFFVPMDIAGRVVRVEGSFEIREVPADEIAHYLEDAGRHDEAAAVSGPQLGYHIVADGVWVADA